MALGRLYRNPPVVEALCEVFYKGSTWTGQTADSIHERLKAEFPKRQQVKVHHAQFTFDQQGAAAGVKQQMGQMQLRSENGNRLVQVAPEWLTVNQLRPYPRFEEWEPTIYSAVDAYREFAEPTGISRVGVRYINQVTVQKPRILMEDYFTIYPNLPSQLGDTHGPFVLRVEIPAPEPEHSILVTFGSSAPERPDSTTHVLDIYDIFMPAGECPLDDLRKHVLTAHHNVETAFEGSITDLARHIFEPVRTP